jgi:Rod binding domain-containing protein
MNVSSINSLSDARRLFAAEVHATKDPAGQDASAVAAAESRKQTNVAAKQFEAIILRQLLAPAIEPLMSGGMIGGQSSGGGGGGVYSYLLTDVMANNLSQGGGLGLSQMLEKQLTPTASVTAAQAAAVYGTGKVKTHEQ